MATALLSVVAALGRHDIIAGNSEAVVKTKLVSSLPPVKVTHNLSPKLQIRSETVLFDKFCSQLSILLYGSPENNASIRFEVCSQFRFLET